MNHEPPVPATLDELLRPEWLSAALGLRFPGIEVTRVTRGPVVARMSTNARFAIECAGRLPDGLAPTLCAKGYFSEQQRPMAHVGEPEARFYAALAESSGVHTLTPVYAAVDDETRHGVVITEDVIAAGGRFLDALTPYSVDQTAASLSELARLHAHTWGDAGPADAPWLAPRIAVLLQTRGVEHVRANFEGAVGVEVDPAMRDPQRLLNAYVAIAARDASAGGWAVIHGDTHVGNLFLDASGRPGLVDWQLVQRGHWSLDVAYHIASALETREREHSERDLLAHYLAELRAHGTAPPAPGEAWQAYRQSIVYGLYLWAITVYVEPAIIRRLLQRLSAAAAAHDSFKALGV